MLQMRWEEKHRSTGNGEKKTKGQEGWGHGLYAKCLWDMRLHGERTASGVVFDSVQPCAARAKDGCKRVGPNMHDMSICDQDGRRRVVDP